MKKPTAFMKRVLTAIRDCPDGNATEFAEVLFKGNPKLGYMKATGHGVTQGTRMNFAAATARKNAVRLGFARETFDVKSRRWTYSLTAEGRGAILG